MAQTANTLKERFEQIGFSPEMATVMSVSIASSRIEHIEADGTSEYMIENQRGLQPGQDWLDFNPANLIPANIDRATFDVLASGNVLSVILSENDAVKQIIYFRDARFQAIKLEIMDNWVFIERLPYAVRFKRFFS